MLVLLRSSKPLETAINTLETILGTPKQNVNNKNNYYYYTYYNYYYFLTFLLMYC